MNTVDVSGKTGDYRVDTGFIVFNEQNYPHFVRLLELLDVDSQPTRMGFSVRSERTGIEYSGESIPALFGGIRNIIDPKHWAMVRDILRFHKLAEQADDPSETVSEFVRRNGLGERFESSFLLPLGRPCGPARSNASDPSLWSFSPIFFPIIRCCRHTTARSGGY